MRESVHEEGEGGSTSDGTLIIEGVYAICALFSYRNSYAVCARQSISSSSSRQGVRRWGRGPRYFYCRYNLHFVRERAS